MKKCCSQQSEVQVLVKVLLHRFDTLQKNVKNLQYTQNIQLQKLTNNISKYLLYLH